MLHLGVMVAPGDIPITEVTTKNLDTGLDLKLTQIDLGPIFTNLLYEAIPCLPFDPSKHKGVWEIKVKDEKENEAVANTHRLDKVGKMPYVGNIKASGNPLAPMITWSAPEKDYPPECKIDYRVRLLKDAHNQFYRSKKPIYDLKHQLPEGILKSENIPTTYIRIECRCSDPDDKDHPVPIELKSETFRPLKEALGQ